MGQKQLENSIARIEAGEDHVPSADGLYTRANMLDYADYLTPGFVRSYLCRYKSCLAAAADGLKVCSRRLVSWAGRDGRGRKQ